jgi:basic membrane protein A
MNTRVLALCAAGALFLAGCNGGDSGSTTTTAGGNPTPVPKPAATFKVALLTPGKVSDAGWNALAYKGLQAIHTELGAEVANKYNEPSIAVGKDFPAIVFISSSGGKTAPNVGAFRFELEQGFYLAGMMAAKMSKSGIIAEVGGLPDIPSIESTFHAFEAGAKSVNPKIVVKKVYAGSFDDIAKAQTATETVIGQGADFVIHQANNAAQGVFNACKAKGVNALGANADQNANDSGAVIASATIVADPAFIDLAKQVKAGTYKGTVTPYGMEKGAIDFVINPNMKSKVPADVVKLLDDTKKKITDGKLAVPMDQF